MMDSAVLWLNVMIYGMVWYMVWPYINIHHCAHVQCYLYPQPLDYTSLWIVTPLLGSMM